MQPKRKISIADEDEIERKNTVGDVNCIQIGVVVRRVESIQEHAAAGTIVIIIMFISVNATNAMNKMKIKKKANKRIRGKKMCTHMVCVFHSIHLAAVSSCCVWTS